MDILQILHIPEIPGEIAISGMFPQPDKTGNFGSLIKTYIDIGTFYFLSLTSDRVEKNTRSVVKRQLEINILNMKIFIYYQYINILAFIIYSILYVI